MKKSSLFVALCCVVTVVMLTQCVCGEKKPSPAQTVSARGIISDRNGLVLVSNDTSYVYDSARAVIIRNYPNPVAAQLLGYVEYATPADLADDNSYVEGDIIGKAGIERYYDRWLRGKDGMPGKNLTLTIDYELQKLGEDLMEGKIGSIVAIEPSSGEVLCMVSSPTYNPQLLVGHREKANKRTLLQDSLKPLLNRSIMGQYSPGGVFKAAQGLVYLSVSIISPQTQYPCERGFTHDGLSIGCHGHPTPFTLVDALRTSCNGYFCRAHLDMMNHKKFRTVQDALEKWRDDITSLGFGNHLGIDLPNEKRGLIPNADFYDKAYRDQWSGLTILSNAIGQGEILCTPLQLANLSATIANRGHYYSPHVVKEIQEESINKKYKLQRLTQVSRDAYDVVIHGMRQSVLFGTCRTLSRLPIEVCGVSGMASYKEYNHSVFIGFAPVEDPKIAIAVYVENGGWGAKYAAPIGGYILEKYLNGELSEASMKKVKQIKEQHIGYEK